MNDDAPLHLRGTLEGVFYAIAESTRDVWTGVSASLAPNSFELHIVVETHSTKDADKVLDRLHVELSKYKPATLWVAIETRIV